MRRGKVELKRIEGKCNRLVSFSKRRTGLFKKALELSVLCDVHIAVAVVSRSGKLYDFSGGNSFNNIIERYGEHLRSQRTAPANDAGIGLQRSLKEAALGEGNHMEQIIPRLSEGQCIQELNAPDLTQLEHNLDAALRQTRRLIEEKMQLEAKAQDTMEIEALLPNEERRMMELNNYLEKDSPFPLQDMHGLRVTEEWSNLSG